MDSSGYKDLKYINEVIRNPRLADKEYEEVGRMLGSMADKLVNPLPTAPANCS